MEGLSPQPQGAQAQAPRDPSAHDETLQTLPSLVALRNVVNPAPGLAQDLVNFARVVQSLVNQLESALSDSETEQLANSDAESDDTPVPATPVAHVTDWGAEPSTPLKVRRLS